MTPFKKDAPILSLIERGVFTSAEVIPPRNGLFTDSVLDQVAQLVEAGASFLAVTKGAGGSLRGGSLPMAQMIKEKFNCPCIAHFVTRDLSPEEVENTLMDHHYFGITNVLALRGDPPQGVDDWQPHPRSYPYAYQLVEHIHRLNRGDYLQRKGYKTQSPLPTDFCIGVAAYPDAETSKERIDYLKTKISAGAQFAITQMVFDPDSYARLCDDVPEIPIVPGIRLLKSQKQAKRITEGFGVPVPDAVIQGLPTQASEMSQEEWLDKDLEWINSFKKRGAPGVHFFVLQETERVARLLQALNPKSNDAKN